MEQINLYTIYYQNEMIEKLHIVIHLQIFY